MKHILLILIFGLLPTGLSAHPFVKKAISLHMAKEMAQAAEAKAKEMKTPLSIVVIDNDGHLIYFARMNGAGFATIDFARRKAHTALITGKSTKLVQDKIAQGDNIILSLDGIFPVQGGLPIIVDGDIIGAIAASGAPPEKDEAAVQAGLDILKQHKAKKKP